MAQATYTVSSSAILPPPVAPIRAPDASSSIKAYIDAQALRNGLNPDLLDCLALHESNWDASRVGDVGNKNGESYGLFQIEVAQHPDITQAEALNYEDATAWTINEILKGHISWWSVYSQKPYYCENIKVFL